MSTNELTVRDYFLTAAIGAAKRNGHEALVEASRAFLTAAPSARPTNLDRSDLRAEGFALHQITIPKNVAALDALEAEHFGGIVADEVHAKTLLAVVRAFGSDAFYGRDSQGLPNLESDVAEALYEAVAKLAVNDGFSREVQMTRELLDKAQAMMPFAKEPLKRQPAIPLSSIEENVSTFIGLKEKHLTGKFVDKEMRATALVALEEVATQAAQHRFYSGPTQKVLSPTA